MMKLPLASKGASVRQLLAHLGARRGQVALVVVVQTVASLAAVSLPWILGVVIDGIEAGQQARWVLTMLGIAFAMVMVAGVLNWVASYRARVLGEEVFSSMRVELMDSLTRLPLSAVENAGSGDLLARTTHDMGSVQHLVRNGISAMLTMVITFTVTVGAAFASSWILAALMLVGLPFIVVVARWYYRHTTPVYRACAAGQASLAGMVTETIDHGETVDSLRLGRVRMAYMDAVVKQVWRMERYGAWTRMLLFVALVFGTLLPLLVVISVGVYLVSLGWLSAGQVTTVTLLGYQARGPVWEATFWLDELQFAIVALQRIFGVGKVPADRTPTVSRVKRAEIEASNVSYAYRDGQPVLHDVSLTLRPGERLAIVGPSGAGKSTFGRMLAGIHPPSSGSVSIDGVPLVDLTEDELRSHVVLVTQEHHVFVGSIADNLRLAAHGRDVSDEAIAQALAAVGASEWVAGLEKGIDTAVGAGGVELSPAQAQQIALARIIVMDPHTVVLDEATSLLDASVARSLEQSLASLLEGRTVVAIAHRLHTAHDADRVAVMEDGRIIEYGSHDELVALGGAYAHLWEQWTKR